MQTSPISFASRGKGTCEAKEIGDVCTEDSSSVTFLCTSMTTFQTKSDWSITARAFYLSFGDVTWQTRGKYLILTRGWKSALVY